MAKFVIVILRVVGFKPIGPTPFNWAPRWSYSSTHNKTLHILQRTIGTRIPRGRLWLCYPPYFYSYSQCRYPGCLPSFSFLYSFDDAVEVVFSVNIFYQSIHINIVQQFKYNNSNDYELIMGIRKQVIKLI